MNRLIISALLFSTAFSIQSQTFAPAPGNIGTTAIKKDSSSESLYEIQIKDVKDRGEKKLLKDLHREEFLMHLMHLVQIIMEAGLMELAHTIV